MSIWLDVAIGLSFTFGLFAAVTSGVMELIAWAAELRARTLRNELARLLGDPHAKGLFGYRAHGGLSHEVLAHPLVREMYRSPWVPSAAGPSYIPRSAFGAAALDLLVGRDAVKAAPELRAALDNGTQPVNGAPTTDAFAAKLTAVLDAASASAADADDLVAAAKALAADRRGMWTKRFEALPSSLLRALVLGVIEPGAADERRELSAQRIVRFIHPGLVADRLRRVAEGAAPSTERAVILAVLDAASPEARRVAVEQVEAAVRAGGARLASLQQLTSTLPNSDLKTALLAVQAEVDVAQRQVKLLDLHRLALTDPVAELRHAIELMGPGSETGRVLSALLDRGVTSMADARARLEGWFDLAMEHCSAIYRRSTRFVLVALSALLVGVVDLDAVRLTRALVNDATLRSQVTQAAAVWVQRHPEAPPAAPPEGHRDVNTVVGHLDETRAQVVALRLPIGRTGEPWPWEKEDPLWSSLEKLLGLLCSVLAVSQGAPFWFALVNRLVSLRAEGRPPSSPRDAGAAPPS